ncbi:MAG TPA: proprotein convertase P-domain-containing protein, partial [Gemmatales bacterium]|nr:proprotein convertase P-domain-containing protein [Gemmatales bacterium]
MGSREVHVTTDANGAFRFFGMQAGDYILRLATPAGHNYTTTNVHNLNLPPNGFIDSLNFGLALQNAIYGHVYDDQNGNGSQDASETGIGNWRIYHDANNNGVYDAGIVTTNSGTLNLTIPDNNTAWTSIPLAVSGFTGSIIDVNVLLNMSHTWVGDMEFRLLGPNGTTTVNLITRRGGSGDNFVNTILDDQAPIAISAGTAPFTGSFRPEQALSAFHGQNPNGTWTLQARDLAGGDVGVLHNWSLIITDDTAEPTAISQPDGTWMISQLPPGTFRARQVQQIGWLPINPAFGQGYTGALQANESIFGLSFGLQVDNTAPVVSSIVRAGSNPTNAATIEFIVTYSEAVVGVGVGSFSLSTAGIAGASISSVSGSGTTYTVTVQTGSGDGTIQLNHLSSSNVTDLALNPLTTPYQGEAYTIDKTAPTVASFKLIYGNNFAYELIGSHRFTIPWQITAIEVTFSESVNGSLGSLIRSNGSLPISSFTGSGTNTLR